MKVIQLQNLECSHVGWKPISGDRFRQDRLVFERAVMSFRAVHAIKTTQFHSLVPMARPERLLSWVEWRR